MNEKPRQRSEKATTTQSAGPQVLVDENIFNRYFRDAHLIWFNWSTVVELDDQRIKQPFNFSDRVLNGHNGFFRSTLTSKHRFDQRLNQRCTGEKVIMLSQIILRFITMDLWSKYPSCARFNWYTVCTVLTGFSEVLLLPRNIHPQPDF